VKKAYFGMGCFWSPQHNLESVQGVLDTCVGYAGGEKENPTYESLGDHTETVEVTYDETKTSYTDLLQFFWEEHDPTVPHKRQYRSLILYTNDDEKDEAMRSLGAEAKKYVDPILTDIEPLGTFYPAEEYHQHYIKKRNEA
jgi:peptide-methionine (S)-S-oxide reductase